MKHTPLRKKANSKTQSPRSKYWRNKADAEITRLYKNEPCWICHKLPSEPHHLLAKSQHALHRHSLENLMPLCPSHHRFGKMAPHSVDSMAVQDFNDYIRRVFPDTWAWMEAHRFDKGKPDYRAAYERLCKVEAKCVYPERGE